MRLERKWALRGAVALFLALAIVVSASPVHSLSSGVGLAETGSGTARGCTCHSPTMNGHAAISLTFEMTTGELLASPYYEGGKTYTMRLSFQDPDVPMNATPTANHGGFTLWASAGKFKLNANSSRTVGSATVALVQLMDSDQTVTHTRDGDVLGNRSWSFDWVAPQANESDVLFDVVVNAVNGDNTNSAADRWTRTSAVLPGAPGGGGGVEISELGVPLRAYWLGIIGILSTMFLLLLSFYVIRSGSKFYEFGLPRGQVKAVKIRTIPPPKNKGAYAVMTGLIVILLVIVLAFLSIKDEQLDALQATLFLTGFFIVLVLAAVYYIRAFLPIVDVIEEETIEPLR